MEGVLLMVAGLDSDFRVELFMLREDDNKNPVLSFSESLEDLELLRDAAEDREECSLDPASAFSCCFLALLSPTRSTFGSVQTTSNIFLSIFNLQS